MATRLPIIEQANDAGEICWRQDSGSGVAEL